jgi:hypothetical protein
VNLSNIYFLFLYPPFVFHPVIQKGKCRAENTHKISLPGTKVVPSFEGNFGPLVLELSSS